MRIPADGGISLYTVLSCVSLCVLELLIMYNSTLIHSYTIEDQLHTLERVRCASLPFEDGYDALMQKVEETDQCVARQGVQSIGFFTRAADIHQGKPLSVQLLIGDGSSLREVANRETLRVQYRWMEANEMRSLKNITSAVSLSDSLHLDTLLFSCKKEYSLCVTNDLLKVRLRSNRDYMVSIEVLGVFNGDGKMIEYKNEDLALVYRSYNTKDKSAIMYVKSTMCLLSVFAFWRLIASLKGSKLKDRLTIQMMVKYLGFLMMIATLPFFDGFNKTTSIAGIFLLIVESLFVAYLSVFLLIMLPSVASEKSTQRTKHNTGWKKVFLLVYFLSLFSFRFLFFKGLESASRQENMKDKGWVHMDWIQAFTWVMIGISLAYCLVWTARSLGRWSQLENRYKCFIMITMSFLPAYYYMNIVTPVRLDSTAFLICLKWIILPLYVIFLQLFFSRKPLYDDEGIPSKQESKGIGSSNINSFDMQQVNSTDINRTEETDGTDRIDTLEYPSVKEKIKEMNSKTLRSKGANGHNNHMKAERTEETGYQKGEGADFEANGNKENYHNEDVSYELEYDEKDEQ